MWLPLVVVRGLAADSAEALAAVGIEALARANGLRKPSSFWVLQQRELDEVPAGLCVAGANATIDGWYAATDYKLFGAVAFRKGSLHISAYEFSGGRRFWYLSDLRNLSYDGDDIDLFRTVNVTNSTLPPLVRSDWGRIKEVGVPFMLAADDSEACDLAKDPWMAFDLTDVITCLVAGCVIACPLLFRRVLILVFGLALREERAERVVLEEDEADGLGAPPQPRLRTLLDVDEEDEEEEVLPLRLPSFAPAWAAVRRAFMEYLCKSRDLTKPGVVLLLILLRTEDHNNLENPGLALVALLSILDLWRATVILAFTSLRYLGLGELRDEERALCLSSDDFVNGAALAAVFAIDAGRSGGRGDLPLVAGAAASVATAVSFLARLARARLAHLVAVSDRNFWRRALAHARLSLLLVLAQLVLGILTAVCLRRAPTQVVFAFAARASKKTTQALGHHLVLAYYELGPALRKMFGWRRPRHKSRRYAFTLAAYYVEFIADVLELGLIFVCYASLVVDTKEDRAASSILFAMIAQFSFLKFKNRISFHYQWKRTRAALQATSTFQVASDSDLAAYNDCCSVCMDDFGPDQTAVKLRCNHIFHLSCLQLYIDTSHTRIASLDCPICCTPIAPSDAADHPAPSSEHRTPGAADRQDHDDGDDAATAAPTRILDGLGGLDDDEDDDE